MVKDTTVRLKKEIFDQIQSALSETGQQVRSLFKIVDVDGSAELDVDEVFSMFTSMRLNVNRTQCQQIFDSLDFDGSNSVSLPEFQADFNDVIRNDLETLLRANQQENSAQMNEGGFDAFSLVDTMNLPTSEAKEIAMQNKIDRLSAKEKRLQKRLADMFMIMNNSEQSCAQFQQLNNGLEKENEMMHIRQSKLLEHTAILEAAQSHSLNRKDADNMV